jgi:hypothetical protein
LPPQHIALLLILNGFRARNYLLPDGGRPAS